MLPSCPVRSLLALMLLAACGASKPYVVAFQPNVPCSTGGPCYGRAITVAADPNDAKHLLVVSESGGVFVTTDGGKSFKHLDALPSFNVVDMAFAPSSSSLIIATASADYHIANGPIWVS